MDLFLHPSMIIDVCQFVPRMKIIHKIRIKQGVSAVDDIINTDRACAYLPPHNTAGRLGSMKTYVSYVITPFSHRAYTGIKTEGFAAEK